MVFDENRSCCFPFDFQQFYLLSIPFLFTSSQLTIRHIFFFNFIFISSFNRVDSRTPILGEWSNLLKIQSNGDFIQSEKNVSAFSIAKPSEYIGNVICWQIERKRGGKKKSRSFELYALFPSGGKVREECAFQLEEYFRSVDPTGNVDHSNLFASKECATEYPEWKSIDDRQLGSGFWVVASKSLSGGNSTLFRMTDTRPEYRKWLEAIRIIFFVSFIIHSLIWRNDSTRLCERRQGTTLAFKQLAIGHLDSMPTQHTFHFEIHTISFFFVDFCSIFSFFPFAPTVDRCFVYLSELITCVFYWLGWSEPRPSFSEYRKWFSCLGHVSETVVTNFHGFLFRFFFTACARGREGWNGLWESNYGDCWSVIAFCVWLFIRNIGWDSFGIFQTDIYFEIWRNCEIFWGKFEESMTHDS